MAVQFLQRAARRRGEKTENERGGRSEGIEKKTSGMEMNMRIMN